MAALLELLKNTVVASSRDNTLVKDSISLISSQASLPGLFVDFANLKPSSTAFQVPKYLENNLQ